MLGEVQSLSTEPSVGFYACSIQLQSPISNRWLSVSMCTGSARFQCEFPFVCSEWAPSLSTSGVFALRYIWHSLMCTKSHLVQGPEFLGPVLRMAFHITGSFSILVGLEMQDISYGGLGCGIQTYVNHVLGERRKKQGVVLFVSGSGYSGADSVNLH